MKVCFVLVFIIPAVFAAASPKEHQTFNDLVKIWVEAVKPFTKECVKKSGVSQHLADRLLPFGEFVNDHKLSCYMNCLLLGIQVINNNGHLQDEGLRKIASVSKSYNSEEVVKKCKRVQSSKACETAFKAGRCVYYTVKQEMEKHAKKVA